MSSCYEELKILALIALEMGGLKAADFASILTQGPIARGGLIRAEKEVQRLERAGINLCVFGAENYPSLLTQLHEPPILFFYRGENLSPLLEKTCVSIVGARKADQAACDVACDFAQRVADGGGCVVSGLAYGIDAHAHLGALQSKHSATTVAVLGNGLEFGIYPSAHERLAYKILDDGGLLLSQFPTQMKPFPSNFLDRNRVIAALSKATLIVQAAERSGALATARHALELGRDVLAVPGGVGDARYVGSNRLIKQGAYLVSEAEDLFALIPELSPPKTASRTSSALLSELQLTIQAELAKAGPTHYDSFLRMHPDPAALANAVDELEEFKMISRLPGNFISLRPKL